MIWVVSLNVLGDPVKINSNVRRANLVLHWLNTFAALVFLLAVVLTGSPLASKAMSVTSATSGILPSNSILKPGLNSTTLTNTAVFVYLPENIVPNPLNKPAHILFALHGINSSGEIFDHRLLEFAQQNHLVLLAPTFKFDQPWQNPRVVAEEESRRSAQLNLLVEELNRKTGWVQFNNEVILYGFSRGTQLAHRFALLHPQRTLGVAVLSAGNYA